MKKKIITGMLLGLALIGFTSCEDAEVENHDHEHSYTEHIEDASCTSTGVKKNVCECGDEVDVETIPAKGHKYNSGVVTKAATHTEEGIKTFTCSDCNDSYTEIIPKITTHNYETISYDWQGDKCTAIAKCFCNDEVTETVTATYTLESSLTCTSDETGKYTAVFSNPLFSKQEINVTKNKAVGHDYKWIQDVAPTFDTTGIKHEECQVCHEKRNENTVIDKLTCAHANLVKTGNVESTCVTNGIKEYYFCNDCNRYYEENECITLIANIVEWKKGAGLANLKNHEFGTWINQIDATCIDDGELGHYHCSVCNLDYDAEYKNIDAKINALGHSWQTSYSYDASYHFYECDNCDLHKDEIEHSYHFVKKDPTYIEDGYSYYLCDDCGSEDMYQVLPKLTQETPTYTLPTGLTAKIGDTLADIELPAGFKFVDPSTTSVGNAGNNTFKVTYTVPNDAISKYKTVEDTVTINVSKLDANIVLSKSNYNKVFDNTDIQVLDEYYSALDGANVEYEFIDAETNNVLGKNVKDAGNYKLRFYVTENETYLASEKIIEFTITKATSTISLNPSNVNYTGNEYLDEDLKLSSNMTKTPTIEYKLLSEDDSLYSLTKPVNVGNYMVRVTYPLDSNFTGSLTSVSSFAITKSNDYSITPLSQVNTYSGYPILYTNYTFTLDEPLTIEYKKYDELDSAYSLVAPINAGSYNVRITFNGEPNYYNYTRVVELTIEKADVEIEALPTILLYKGQLIRDAIFNDAVTSVTGKFSLSNGTSEIHEKLNLDLTFTPDNTNYNSKTIEVEVEPISLYVEYEIGENGSAKFEADNLGASGKFNVLYGRNAVINIIPDDGYAISVILIDGLSSALNTNYTIYNVIENRTFKVTFEVKKEYYTVTNTISAGLGTIKQSDISVVGENTVESGTDYRVIIKPQDGYSIKSVVINGTNQIINYPDSEYAARISSVDGDSEIIVEFVKNPTMTVTSNGHATIEGGTVTYDPSHTFVYNQTAVLRVVPDEGYYIKSITRNGTEIEMAAYQKRSFSQNYKITVDEEFYIETALNPTLDCTHIGDGLIRFKGEEFISEVSVEYSYFATLYISPNSGYYLSSIKINGIEKLNGPSKTEERVDFNVYEDTLVEVIFTSNPKINLTITGNGSLNTQDNGYGTNILNGKSFTYNAYGGTVYGVADEYNHIVSMTVNGELQSINQNNKFASYYLGYVTNDIDIDLVFVANPKITSIVTGNGKIVSGRVDFTNSSIYSEDYPVSLLYISATADKDNYIDSVTINGTACEVVNTNSFNHYLDKYTGDVTIEVVFKPFAKVNVNNPSGITGTYRGENILDTSISYSIYDYLTYSFIPSTGYMITSITIDGIEQLEEATNRKYDIDFQVLSDDIDIIVTTEKIQYSIECGDYGYFTYTYSKTTYYYGDIVTLHIDIADSYSQSENYYVMFNNGYNYIYIYSYGTDAEYTFDEYGNVDIELLGGNARIVTGYNFIVNEHNITVYAKSTDWETTTGTRILDSDVRGNEGGGSHYTATDEMTTTVKGNIVSLKFNRTKNSSSLKDSYALDGVYLTENDYNNKTNNIFNLMTLNSDGVYEYTLYIPRDDFDDIKIYTTGHKTTATISIVSETEKTNYTVNSSKISLVKTEDITTKTENHVTGYTGTSLRSGYTINAEPLEVYTGVVFNIYINIPSNKYFMDIKIDGESIMNKLQSYSFTTGSTFNYVNVTFTPMPNCNHVIEVVTVDDAAHMVDVTIEDDIYNTGIYGTVDVTSSMVNHLDSLTITATPNPGYEAVFACENEETVIANTFTLKNVTDNMRVKVSFRRTSVYAENISTEQELINKINSDSHGYYKLINDITLTNAWTAVKFYGVLDGNNHTIYNLSLAPVYEHAVGFFSFTSGALIKNINFEDVNIRYNQSGAYTNSTVGTVVGIANFTVFDNVHVNSGYIDGTGTYVGSYGGVVGFIEAGSTVDNSSSSITLTGGGFAGGFAAGIANSNVSNSYYDGDAQIESITEFGGFAISITNSKVTNCYAETTVSSRINPESFWANFHGVGGFVFDVRNSSISYSYANVTIDVTCNGACEVGGFAGTVFPGSRIEYCYATGSINVSGSLGVEDQASSFVTHISGFVGVSLGKDTYNECYTTSNISVTKTTATNYSQVSVGGFTTLFAGSGVVTDVFITNCFVTGNIEIANNVSFTKLKYSPFIVYETYSPQTVNCLYLNEVDTSASGAQSNISGVSQANNIYAQNVNKFDPIIWDFVENQAPVLK